MYSRHTDGDVCIDSHSRTVCQRNAASHYLGSTMTTESISGLVLMHVHKDTELDAERIIHQFGRQNRHLALLFRPE